MASVKKYFLGHRLQTPGLKYQILLFGSVINFLSGVVVAEPYCSENARNYHILLFGSAINFLPGVVVAEPYCSENARNYHWNTPLQLLFTLSKNQQTDLLICKL